MSDHTISAKAPATPPDIKAFRDQLGETLKQAREKAGMSYDAVAQITKITRTFIVALETGDLERLPGVVFGRGFVRSIARVLELDPDELCQIYVQCWVPSGTEKTLKVGAGQGTISNRMPARRRLVFDIGNMMKKSTVSNMNISGGKSVALLVAIPLFALVVAMVTAGVKRGQKPAAKPDLVAQVAVQSAVEPEVVVPANPQVVAKEPVAPRLVKEEPVKPPGKPPVTPVLAIVEASKPAVEEPALELRSEKANFEHVLELVVIEPVKIKMLADGKQPSIRQLKPDAYRFTFTDRAELTVYDAAAVEVAFNGRSLGSLGAKGRIRKLIFQSGNPESASNNQVGETAKKL